MTVDWPRVIGEAQMSHRQLDYVVNSDAFVNLAEGAVRAGKTMSGLLRWLIKIAASPGKGDLVVCGKTFDTVTRNVFNPLREAEVFGEFASSVHYTRGAPTAQILGETIEVITFNDERSEARLRGATVKGAYVDEWSLMPRSFNDQLLARCSVEGAQIFGNTNPDNPMHWLKADFIDESGPGGRVEADWKVWKFLLDDNPTLSDKIKARYRRQYIGLWYKRMILGQWVMAEGAIYESWDPDVHVVRDKDMPKIERWISLGVDHGTVAPFAALLLGLGEDGLLYLAREWRWDSKKKQRQMADVEYSRQLIGWLTEQGMPEWVCVDPEAANFRRQLLNDGLVSHTADNGVRDGIRLVASLLALGVLRVHESCEGWITEAPAYTWDPKKAMLGIDEPIKLNDHSLDAGRYAIKTPEVVWRNLIKSDVELSA